MDKYEHLFIITEMTCGFQGSPFVNTIENRGKGGKYKLGHLASTYSALCSLLALGDDLSRVKRQGIIKSNTIYFLMVIFCFK